MRKGHNAEIYPCPFEIGLCSGKEEHSRFDRVETGLLSRTLPIGTKGADRSTQAIPPARRDALCPSTKIQKQAAFGITLGEGLQMPVQKDSHPA